VCLILVILYELLRRCIPSVYSQAMATTSHTAATTTTLATTTVTTRVIGFFWYICPSNTLVDLPYCGRIRCLLLLEVYTYAVSSFWLLGHYYPMSSIRNWWRVEVVSLIFITLASRRIRHECGSHLRFVGHLPVYVPS